MAAKRKSGAGAATFLLVVGCLAVLGATFALGLMAGRHWPGFPFARREPAAKVAREKERDRSERALEPTPTLTFYQELTAPLTAPPRVMPPKPPRVERAEPPKPDTAKPNTAKPDTTKPDAPPPVTAGAPQPDSRFTVQVGAYRAREPADALRARLAAQGHDAYVVEADGPGGVRFRVRVGSYATREAAQAMAVRIGGAQSAFVTTR